MRGPASRIIAVLLAAVGVVAGCSGDDDTAGVGAAAGLAGETPLSDELVAAAQSEGALTVYTSNSDMEDFAAEFGDQYDIDVDVYRADSATVVQRLLQEVDAGRNVADVVENHLPEMLELEQRSVLEPIESAAHDALPDDARFDGWTTVRYNAMVVARNTDLVSDEDAPTTWADLADPRWEGVLALEPDDWDWYMTLHQLFQEDGRTESEADELLAAIVANGVQSKGHTAQVELLGAGEFSLVASAYSHGTDRANDAGAPVEWRDSVEPVILRPSGVGILRGTRHPAAAVLFYEWLLTEAQDDLAAAFRIPVLAAAGRPLGDAEVRGVDPDLVRDEGTTWSRRYREDLG